MNTKGGTEHGRGYLEPLRVYMFHVGKINKTSDLYFTKIQLESFFIICLFFSCLFLMEKFQKHYGNILLSSITSFLL